MFPVLFFLGLIVCVIAWALLTLRDAFSGPVAQGQLISKVCPSCRYSLEGLLQPLCPECGSELPAFDPATCSVPAPEARSPLSPILAWTFVCVVAAVILLPLIVDARRNSLNQATVEYVVRNDILLAPRGESHPCVDIVRIEAKADFGSWTETIATASDASGHFARLKVTDQLDRAAITRWLAAIPCDDRGDHAAAGNALRKNSKPCSALDPDDVLEVFSKAMDAKKIDSRKLRASEAVEYATIRYGLGQHILRAIKPTATVAVIILGWISGVWLIVRRVANRSHHPTLHTEVFGSQRSVETTAR